MDVLRFLRTFQLWFVKKTYVDNTYVSILLPGPFNSFGKGLISEMAVSSVRDVYIDGGVAMPSFRNVFIDGELAMSSFRNVYIDGEGVKTKSLHCLRGPQDSSSIVSGCPHRYI